jgi:hypothetical protein
VSISPFFHNLASAYQAEMDDLSSDSEGKDVLRQRLTDKRQEIGFLRQMIEVSPEMVAVVFHQGFEFKRPGLMEQVVSQGSDELLAWGGLADAVVLRPWAQILATEVLKEPRGAWFMSLAAGLEYLYSKPGSSPSSAQDEVERDPHGQDSDDDQDPQEQSLDEAGADWLAEQGFDRKD